MKKFLSIIISIVVLTSFFSLNVSAETYDKPLPKEIVISEKTEYFADGSSITTTITQVINDNQNETRATRTVTGSKIKTVKNSSGNVLYKFKITGTFSVNEGVSATCTAVACTASDLASGWSLASSTTSKSGNTAYATGIFKYKVLGITTQSIETPNTLTCSTTGTLS